MPNEQTEVAAELAQLNQKVAHLSETMESIRGELREQRESHKDEMLEAAANFRTSLETIFQRIDAHREKADRTAAELTLLQGKLNGITAVMGMVQAALFAACAWVFTTVSGHSVEIERLRSADATFMVLIDNIKQLEARLPRKSNQAQ